MDTSKAVTAEEPSSAPEDSSTVASTNGKTNEGFSKETSNNVKSTDHPPQEKVHLPNDAPPPYKPNQPYAVNTVQNSHHPVQLTAVQLSTFAQNVPFTHPIIREAQVKPNNHLASAITVLICCCIPVGIVAVVYSSQVNSRFANGDYEGAMQSSQASRKWCIIGLVWGVIIYGLMVGLRVLFQV